MSFKPELSGLIVAGVLKRKLSAIEDACKSSREEIADFETGCEALTRIPPKVTRTIGVDTADLGSTDVPDSYRQQSSSNAGFADFSGCSAISSITPGFGETTRPTGTDGLSGPMICVHVSPAWAAEHQPQLDYVSRLTIQDWERWLPVFFSCFLVANCGFSCPQ
jgi:hypothetical protein